MRGRAHLTASINIRRNAAVAATLKHSTTQQDTLSSFTTNAPGQLNVLGHDSDALGVNGAQVGVLKQTHQVSLSCLLESENSVALEAKVRLHNHTRYRWRI